ncbi:UNVERIFIED_CONTAM: hypothetical protein NCL1_63432 [Trichonephila clavipes]
MPAIRWGRRTSRATSTRSPHWIPAWSRYSCSTPCNASNWSCAQSRTLGPTHSGSGYPAVRFSPTAGGAPDRAALPHARPRLRPLPAGRDRSRAATARWKSPAPTAGRLPLCRPGAPARLGVPRHGNAVTAR